MKCRMAHLSSASFYILKCHFTIPKCHFTIFKCHFALDHVRPKTCAVPQDKYQGANNFLLLIFFNARGGDFKVYCIPLRSENIKLHIILLFLLILKYNKENRQAHKSGVFVIKLHYMMLKCTYHVLI